MTGVVLGLRATAAPGRPVGEVRTVIERTLREVGPMTQRDLALRCQIGCQAVENTMKRMVHAGNALIVGREKRDYSRKCVALYDLPPEPSADDDSRHGHGWVDLARCIQGWSR